MRPVSAAYELGRSAIAVIVSPWSDLDAMSNQDATDARGCAAAQNAGRLQQPSAGGDEPHRRAEPTDVIDLLVFFLGQTLHPVFWTLELRTSR